MHKFPRTAYKKWNRYNFFEKIFIVYILVLIWLELFLPILKITWEWNVREMFYMIDKTFPFISSVNIFSLLFMLIWNVSFRFKRFINIVFGFQNNDAIVNFGIIWTHALTLLAVKETMDLVTYRLSSEKLIVLNNIYILSGILILGLIWSLILAVSFSSFKKKQNYTNVVFKNDEKSQEDIKSLFE